MSNKRSLTLLLSAVALSLTGLAAQAGPGSGHPVWKPESTAAKTPADKSPTIGTRLAAAGGDFEFVGGEAGWQLRQHQYVLSGGGFTHSPQCVLAANAAAAGTGAGGNLPAPAALPGG